MSVDLKVLVGQRRIVRKKVTDCSNKSCDYPTLDSSAKLCEKGVLIGYRKRLQELNTLIQAQKFSGEFTEEELDSELSVCQTYFDKIERCLPLLDCTTCDGNSNSNPTDVARSLLKQPTAPLPKFSSNDGEDFLKFISEFESTTSSFKYPDRDLLLLLKQQVEGRAKCLLDSLEADKQKYGDAKSLLISAFASTELRIFTTVKKLSELHLDEGCDPFVYISNLRTLYESVRTLNIDSDEFVKYFAWNGLNDRFRLQFVQITNKTHPSLNDIFDHFFTACERYEKQETHDMSPKSKKAVHAKHHSSASNSNTTNFAIKAKIETSKLMCYFCSKSGVTASDHRSYNCKKYPTPSDKIKVLTSLNGCLKCGNFNHKTKDCKFHFRRVCSKCSKYHMDYLCKEESKSNNSPAVSSTSTPVYSKEVSSGIAVLPTITTGSILPTFTFNVGDDEHLYRGLRDSGSQNTFISSKMADIFKLKVVASNVKLTINGFNGPKDYLTN